MTANTSDVPLGSGVQHGHYRPHLAQPLKLPCLVAEAAEALLMS